ncbi:MAG: hypothetical protein MUF64_02905 [Polyangiaceae bacterium]|jgi:hypothetical protein|nr:hypothetical protein [Polyangiaceae bacterium]
MSASQHDASAKEHDKEASAHAASFNPSAKEKTSCSSSKAAQPCWTSEQNPSEVHLKEADKHRKMAEEHRVAAAALRDAEQRSCQGIAPTDRDMSPFHHREDIASVSEIEVSVPQGKNTTKKTEGVAIVLRAVPGLTREYLQRTAECHLARNAVMGFSMPEMSFCPLSIKGVRVSVESVGNGFRAEIRGDSPEAIQEAIRRGKALSGAPEAR